jgi:hypothetical protein
MTAPVIDALFFSFSQLVSIVECKDYEIGAYQFSYFIDMGKEASNFNDFYKTQRIELNDFLESGAFSHEWGHGIDNLLAPHYGESSSGFASDSRKQNPVNILVSNSKLKSPSLNDAQVELFVNRSKSNIQRIMEYSNTTNACTDYKSFQNIVSEELQLLPLNEWNKSAFISKAKPCVRSGRHSIEVIVSEMELMHSLMTTDAKQITKSAFLMFGEILNTNFTYSYRGYWTEKREMFARAFEAYVDFQLKSREMQPLDPLSFVSWQPDSIETNAWLPQWNEVMNVIRKKLEEVSAANRAALITRSEIETTEAPAIQH